MAQPTDKTREGRPLPPGKMLAAVRRMILRTYWATAKRSYQHGNYADYGSPDWCALPIDDPRKMAGLVAFAELWRRYGDEIADNLNQALTQPATLTERATTAALDQAYRSLQKQRKEAA
ncbi:hypothetical protein ACIBWG_02065 [Streptomyces griseoaurantiacus]|uniref:hypothetical protein n=1 Tax=Streptomyces griseoaurantiacus TaxID=68213 RepID=UPI00378C9177